MLFLSKQIIIVTIVLRYCYDTQSTSMSMVWHVVCGFDFRHGDPMPLVEMVWPTVGTIFNTARSNKLALWEN